MFARPNNCRAVTWKSVDFVVWPVPVKNADCVTNGHMQILSFVDAPDGRFFNIYGQEAPTVKAARKRPLRKRLQSEERWSLVKWVKLLARASEVVRIVSLNKYFGTKLKDIGGKGMVFNFARGQNSTSHRAVRGSCYHGVSTWINWKIEKQGW